MSYGNLLQITGPAYEKWPLSKGFVLLEDTQRMRLSLNEWSGQCCINLQDLGQVFRTRIWQRTVTEGGHFLLNSSYHWMGAIWSDLEASAWATSQIHLWKLSLGEAQWGGGTERPLRKLLKLSSQTVEKRYCCFKVSLKGFFNGHSWMNTDHHHSCSKYMCPLLSYFFPTLGRGSMVAAAAWRVHMTYLHFCLKTNRKIPRASTQLIYSFIY